MFGKQFNKFHQKRNHNIYKRLPPCNEGQPYFCHMFKQIVLSITLFFSLVVQAQLTPFERSGGKETATYAQVIAYYKLLAQTHKNISVREIGTTDAGYPLHLVLFSADGKFDPVQWHKNKQVVIMVNNGIHPGEPDGIDASMMLVRDILTGKIKLPARVCLGIIPVYNIGGSLNRGPYSRVNQNGPAAYGFRGNAQNLDLNRDFTKLDSRNAAAFNEAFRFLDPNILVDNHVSDGADFQHTMTLLTSQYDKLGGPIGQWLRNRFEPAIYADMKNRGWDLFPYVNFDAYELSRGMTQFYDPPRYSSGYAALFQCIGFVPETHMLKPFNERVKSTYDLMVSIAALAHQQADSLIAARAETRMQTAAQTVFPLAWRADTSRYSMLTFKGYGRDTMISEVTGLPRMFYRHDKPFDAQVKFYCYFTGQQEVSKPKAYLIPQGWHRVHEKLTLNKIAMKRLEKDTLMEVEAYRIESYTAATRPYESHFRHSNVKVGKATEKILCLKGDYLVEMGKSTDRFVVEMLEPTGADSYFTWNYFDAILQQKEGYSNYRWEEVAAEWLKQNPELKKQLEAKKAAEPDFAKNAGQILNWVYRNSPYFEPSFNRYPVYRIP